MAVTLEAAGFSHKGARQHNEDALLLCDDIGLYVVADGVGGAQGGEVASGIVCETFEVQLRAGNSLTEATDQAHVDVVDAAASEEGIAGAASTAVAVKLEGAQLQLAWVGDSRAYLWDGELQLLSKDHSLVQSLVDTAQLDFAEMVQHPQKNIVTQALGSRNGAPVTASKQGHLRTPCVLMLCSDGVSDELTEQILIATLSSNDSAQTCARTLVETAVNGGGQDNASCIVIRLSDLPPPPPKEPTLAFMRYGTDKLWHLAETTSTEDTQINPATGNYASISRNRTPQKAGAARKALRKLLYTVLGVGLLMAIAYAVETRVGWEWLLDQLK